MKTRILAFALSAIMIFFAIVITAVANKSLPEGIAGDALIEGKYTEEQIREYVKALQDEAVLDPTGFRMMYLYWHDRGETIEESLKILRTLTETYIVPLLGKTGYLEGEETLPSNFMIKAEGDEVFEIYLNILLLCNGNDKLKASPLPPVTQPSKEEVDPLDKIVFYGDLNEDGKINTADYVLAKRYVLGTLKLEDGIRSRLDVSADHKINVADYVMIKRYVMGSLDSFPAGSPTWD